MWALFGGFVIRALFSLLTNAKGSAGVFAPSGQSAEEASFLAWDDLTAPNSTSNVMVQRVLPYRSHPWLGSRPCGMGLPSTRLSMALRLILWDLPALVAGLNPPATIAPWRTSLATSMQCWSTGSGTDLLFRMASCYVSQY